MGEPRRGSRWWVSILVALVPTTFVVTVVAIAVGQPPERPGDRILVPILVVLGLAGVVGCFSSPTRAGGWAYRIAGVLGTAAVVAFLGYLVVGGLLAPGMVADPSSSRGPQTSAEAVVVALLIVGVLVGVVITWMLESRGRRRGGPRRRR